MGPLKTGALFSDIAELSQETLEVLERLNFLHATPVQEATLPLFCGNKDVAVDACTGSGKTLAFVLPVVERLRRLDERLNKYQVGAIIISPTRELARQIHSVAQPFFNSVPGITSQLLVGGTDPAVDVSHFKDNGAHILVGTPGRIDDIMKRCATMDFKRLEVLVLDEADRLLDMGFKQQLDNIMARLPKQRRTGLFSATQTEAVEALARAGLRNPVRVNVAVTNHNRQASTAGSDVQKTPTGLSIQYMQCEADQKLEQLVLFLKYHQDEKVIVYFLTCSCVDFFHLALKRLGPQFIPSVKVHALHGRMKQAAREATLEAYTSQPAGCLLCTDLAARGLDIPDVNWIVQVDPPQDPSSFVHRVGRTARMGRTGNALVMLLPHELSYVEFLQLRKVPLVEAELSPSARAEVGGGKGGLGEGLGSDQVLVFLRKEAEADREVMEAGTRAFVSYVRGYKEHHCKFIFRIQDMSLGRLATSFALLRLPRMPETKKSRDRVENFMPSTIDIDAIKFKDKAREKQRQQAILLRAERDEAEALAANQQVRLKQQRQQMDKDKAHISGERLTATKRRQLQDRDELKDLTEDYGLLKKLKRGKITQHEFNVATGISSDEEEPTGTNRPSKQQRKPSTAGPNQSSKLQQYSELKRRRQERRGKGNVQRG